MWIHEWSDMPSRRVALTAETCHHALTCSSALTALTSRSSLRLPRVGTRIRTSAIASRGSRSDGSTCEPASTGGMPLGGSTLTRCPGRRPASSGQASVAPGGVSEESDEQTAGATVRLLPAPPLLVDPRGPREVLSGIRKVQHDPSHAGSDAGSQVSTRGAGRRAVFVHDAHAKPL